VVSRAQGGSDAAGLTEEELDRLADYLADALDPQDAAEVHRLVAEDPRWSTAHAALTEADAAVREILAGPIYATGPMPADIAARLDSALRDVARTSHPVTDVPTPRVSSVAGVGSITSSAAGSSPAGSSPAASSPVASSPVASSLAAARAKRRRLVMGIAAAAAAAVAIVGGLAATTNLFDRAQQTTAGAGSALDSGGSPSRAEAAAPSAAGAPNEPVFLASGNDYLMTTLGQLSAPHPAFSTSGGVSAQDSAKQAIGPVPQPVREGAPAPLARLLDRAALSACLDAIRAINPGSVVAVDYARFAGSPALVVLVEQGNTSTVVAVGPDCGRSGADQKAAARVP
jgi:hypothetical protein